MLYFAYGSNLDRVQMNKRCPSNAFKCVALLPGFRIAFTRYSEDRKGGVADVVEDPASPGVWGAVYNITEEDLKKLDACEGYYGPGMDNAYDRCGTVVLEDGDKDRPIGVLVYVVANKSDVGHLPDREYLGQIVSGAEHRGLPEEYLVELRGLLEPSE